MLGLLVLSLDEVYQIGLQFILQFLIAALASQSAVLFVD